MLAADGGGNASGVAAQRAGCVVGSWGCQPSRPKDLPSAGSLNQRVQRLEETTPDGHRFDPLKILTVEPI